MLCCEIVVIVGLTLTPPEESEIIDMSLIHPYHRSVLTLRTFFHSHAHTKNAGRSFLGARANELKNGRRSTHTPGILQVYTSLSPAEGRHRMASHRIAFHHIAFHCIASYRMA